MDIEQVREYTLSINGVTEDQPFGDDIITFRINLGTFPTKAGVIWCGVKEGTSATSLANKLRKRLTANGVLFSTLAFVPHISLVQHPSVIVTDIIILDATIRVEKLFVMKSERIDGQLIYSEI